MRSILQLELTPDAELIAIIDPATGDKPLPADGFNPTAEMDRSNGLTHRETFTYGRKPLFHYEAW